MGPSRSELGSNVSPDVAAMESMGKATLEARCPRLGHEVPLGYCYQQPERRPCSRILACWSWRLPQLEEILRRLIPEDKWEEFFAGPQEPKSILLIRAIEQARETMGVSKEISSQEQEGWDEKKG